MLRNEIKGGNLPTYIDHRGHAHRDNLAKTINLITIFSNKLYTLIFGALGTDQSKFISFKKYDYNIK